MVLISNVEPVNHSRKVFTRRGLLIIAIQVDYTVLLISQALNVTASSIKDILMSSTSSLAAALQQSYPRVTVDQPEVTQLTMNASIATVPSAAPSAARSAEPTMLSVITIERKSSSAATKSSELSFWTMTTVGIIIVITQVLH